MLNNTIGTVNVTLATINSSALVAEWSHPEWRSNSLVFAYNFTCSNHIEGITETTLLSSNKFERNVQLNLNLSTVGGYECCVTVWTLIGNGPQSCTYGSPHITSPPITTAIQTTEYGDFTFADEYNNGNN